MRTRDNLLEQLSDIEANLLEVRIRLEDLDSPDDLSTALDEITIALGTTEALHRTLQRHCTEIFRSAPARQEKLMNRILNAQWVRSEGGSASC